MEQFSLDQLRTMLILVIGAIVVLMTALILYVVLAGRKKTNRSVDQAQQSGAWAFDQYATLIPRSRHRRRPTPGGGWWCALSDSG